MKPAGLLRFLSAVAFGLALSGAAFAQDPIKIGAIYPINTSIGKYTRAAIELAKDIINGNDHPELGDLLLTNIGRPRLGGAKIEVVYADSEGDPITGQKKALRLINDDKVVALNGTYHSRVTLTASAAAEQYGIPFLNGDSVADNLTERGFKWFFSTTPAAVDLACMYTEFLKDMKAKGRKVDRIAIVHEDTQYGVSLASVVTRTFKDNGLNITLDIPYSTSANSDYSSEVGKLDKGKPDVVMFMSYTEDAKRFADKMGPGPDGYQYKPPMMIADDAGFSDPVFINYHGQKVQGVLIRSSWSAGNEDTLSYRVNDLYRKKYGADLGNTTARVMQGFIVLVDAINRAGSTKPEKIQDALRTTDLNPEQLIVRYNGVKFDDKGQNIKASAMLTQLQGAGKKYVPVWPEEKGALVLPLKRWCQLHDDVKDGVKYVPVSPKEIASALVRYTGW